MLAKIAREITIKHRKKINWELVFDRIQSQALKGYNNAFIGDIYRDYNKKEFVKKMKELGYSFVNDSYVEW